MSFSDIPAYVRLLCGGLAGLTAQTGKVTKKSKKKNNFKLFKVTQSKSIYMRY